MKIRWAITFLFVLVANQLFSQTYIIKPNQELFIENKTIPRFGCLVGF
jgi:hypothetical protein